MEKVLNIVDRFVRTKKFVTRGATFAKKMWRDGYNKALDDIWNYVTMEIEKQLAEKNDRGIGNHD